MGEGALYRLGIQARRGCKYVLFLPKRRGRGCQRRCGGKHKVLPAIVSTVGGGRGLRLFSVEEGKERTRYQVLSPERGVHICLRALKKVEMKFLLLSTKKSGTTDRGNVPSGCTAKG